MIVYTTSDRGGAGCTVTTSNLAYHLALAGQDVCYVDFAFSSPTAGGVFGIDSLKRGTTCPANAHTFLQGKVSLPQYVDIRSLSDRSELRNPLPGNGRMRLIPGQQGGSGFTITNEMVERCAQLLARLEDEFDVIVVDLSAGRTYATELCLRASRRLLPGVIRWLILHRWTKQHVVTAHGLVHGDHGLVQTSRTIGYDPDEFLSQVRFVRTAVAAVDVSPSRTQLLWLQNLQRDLTALASELGLNGSNLIGIIPFDPVLQWHEQLLTPDDLLTHDAHSPDTFQAFNDLATRLRDEVNRRSS